MDLSTLGIAATIVAFFSALGAAMDSLVLPQQNKRLQDALLHWWNYVDDVRFRDIAHQMVALYVRIERKLLGKFPSWRWFLTAVCTSAIVTTLAIIGGRTIGLTLTLACNDVIDSFGGMWGTITQMWWASIGYFKYNLDHPRIYAINIAFDALTLAATLAFLRLYLRQRLFISRYILILTDILACLVFFYLCSFLAFYSDSTTSGIRYGLFDYYKQFLDVAKDPQCAHFHLYTSTFVFSSTVFLPTFTYLFAIFMLMTAKGSLEISRYAARHLLELSATQQKTVFFYSGVFIGIVGSVLKLAYDLMKLLLQ